MAELVRPSENYINSFLEAIKEFQKENRYTEYDLVELNRDFGSFIAILLSQSEGKNLPQGNVPETTYWLVEGNEFLGRLTIRHSLTKKLETEGGHISYDIRPSKRGRGYGKEILRLGLEKAKELGIENVVITCDVNNIPSQKVIVANGGILEGATVLENGKQKCKYTLQT